MKNKNWSIGPLAALLLLSGCAGGVMRDAPTQQIAGASAGRAKIVFMRTSFVAGAVGVELFEVRNDELIFIGQLPMGKKVVYEVPAGETVFMAYGAAADFMRAKVVAGKTYYSIVRPNWGTGGFAPTPVRTDGTTSYNTSSKDFASWVSGTDLIETDPAKAAKWFKENKERYQKIYADYWARWQNKTEAEKAERTLNPGDGQ